LASQKIPHILWNTKLHIRIQNIPQPLTTITVVTHSYNCNATWELPQIFHL